MSTTVNDLIDRPLIAKADEWLAKNSERLDRAEAAHKVEQTALEAALEASEKAVAGDGGDPLECALRVEEASRRERVAARVLAKAADEHRKASEDRENAGALALKPVHRAWRLRRLAASRKGDAGCKMSGTPTGTNGQPPEEPSDSTVSGVTYIPPRGTSPWPMPGAGRGASRPLRWPVKGGGAIARQSRTCFNASANLWAGKPAFVRTGSLGSFGRSRHQ